MHYIFFAVNKHHKKDDIDYYIQDPADYRGSSLASAWVGRGKGKRASSMHKRTANDNHMHRDKTY